MLQKQGKLHILDLGGYNGLARQLMPNERITILDTFKDDSLEDYIRVNKVGIPSEDNSYDIVICTDVLEHIPNMERSLFIKEAIRVSRHFVFIGAPFGDKGVDTEELYSNMVYKGQTKSDYIWLKEHRNFRLPRKKWIEELLHKQPDIHFTTFSHTSIRLWGVLLSVGFFIANNIAEINTEIAGRLKRLNKDYFDHVSAKDFPENGYRRFYLISKEGAIDVNTPVYDETPITEFVAHIHKELGWAIAKGSQEYNVLKEALEVQNQEVERLQDIERNYHIVLNSRRYRFTEPISRVNRYIKKLSK
jgi:hypothetical protein